MTVKRCMLLRSGTVAGDDIRRSDASPRKAHGNVEIAAKNSNGDINSLTDSIAGMDTL